MLSNPLDFNIFMQWAFLGSITGLVWILWEIKKSVEKLNVKIAIIVERIENQQEKLSEHHERIARLEGINLKGG